MARPFLGIAETQIFKYADRSCALALAWRATGKGTVRICIESFRVREGVGDMGFARFSNRWPMSWPTSADFLFGFIPRYFQSNL